jgi:hypothetical protein
MSWRSGSQNATTMSRMNMTASLKRIWNDLDISQPKPADVYLPLEKENKMNETTAIEKMEDAKLMESVLLQGDLSKLGPTERVNYYRRVCQSIGLNPLTRPFDYISLNGKLTLYAKKDATDQLRNLHGVSIDDVDIVENETQFIVKVKGHNKDGRTDVEIGVVNKTDMQGNLANAQMKAVTKGKRRLTLSLCGLGWLDETEIQSIPDARPVIVDESGEIEDTPASVHLSYEEAAAMTAKGKDGEEKRLDSLTPQQLQYIVEHSKSADLTDAALTVLEHDHQMSRPSAA